MKIYIKSARKAGIMPYISGNPKVSKNTVDPRDALGKIYTSLVNRPAFDLLNGEYDAFDYIPLVADAYNKVFNLEKDTDKPAESRNKLTVIIPIVYIVALAVWNLLRMVL